MSASKANSMTFSVFPNKGFSIKFANGYLLSVMFGYGNYCEHHLNEEIPIGSVMSHTFVAHTSKDCEVAVFNPDGNFVNNFPHFPENSNVAGRVTPSQLAEILAWVVAQ